MHHYLHNCSSIYIHHQQWYCSYDHGTQFRIRIVRVYIGLVPYNCLGSFSLPFHKLRQYNQRRKNIFQSGIDHVQSIPRSMAISHFPCSRHRKIQGNKSIYLTSINLLAILSHHNHLGNRHYRLLHVNNRHHRIQADISISLPSKIRYENIDLGIPLQAYILI